MTVSELSQGFVLGCQTVYCRHMNKTDLMTDRLTELQDFMFDTMPSPEMSVDWFCDRFNVSATDDVIDFVLDAHEGMFADQ